MGRGEGEEKEGNMVPDLEELLLIPTSLFSFLFISKEKQDTDKDFVSTNNMPRPINLKQG